MKPEDKRYTIISLGLIIILGVLVYGNSINGEFIWDDYNLVTRNTYIRDWSNITGIFTKGITAGAGGLAISYRPLQTVSYMIDYSLWKLDVRGYHITNILLHILTALSIYWFVTVLFGDRLVSFLTGVFFVVHPVHTEAISYISGRADPLAAVFMVLCLIFYIRYLGSGRAGIYILVLFTYIAALLSRESGLILLLLFPFYNYSFKKELKFKKFLPILIISFIYILLRLTTLKTQLPHEEITTTLAQRFPGVFAALIDYIKLLILPFDLHMEYGNIIFGFSNPKVFFGILIFSSLLIYALRKKESGGLIFFSIGWFFITLLPQSNLYPLNAYMAEHWLYLPSIGFFLIFAKVLSSALRVKNLKIFIALVIIALSAFYSFVTVRQNNFWKTPIAFYERTLEYASLSPRVHNDLGVAYYGAGRKDRAVELFKRAIELNPRYADPRNNLGSVYSVMGRRDEAIELLKGAIEIKPDYADAYYNLALTYYGGGQYDLAVKYCDKALELGCRVDAEFLKSLGPHRK